MEDLRENIGKIAQILPNINQLRKKENILSLKKRENALKEIIGEKGKIMDVECVKIDHPFYRITGIEITEEDSTFDLLKLMIPIKAVKIL